MKKFLILIPLCAILLPALPAPCGSEAQAEDRTIEVQANKILNDAKLYVQAGDVVSFKAKGEWTVNPKEGISCGPEGEPGTSAPSGYQLPGAPIGALVAVVLGKRYLVGSEKEIAFDNSGPVQLTANVPGKLSAYLGNKGALTVQIEVKKTAAAGINGRYEITFKEDEVVVASGGKKKVIPLEELEKEKVEGGAGGPVQLPADTAQKLKELSGVIDIEVEKGKVIIRDPQNPGKAPLKGLYDPNKKEFLVHLEGNIKQVVGTCYFTHAKNITGRLVSGHPGRDLEGSVNLSLALFCAGTEKHKGKGKGVTVSLPFVGKRVSR